MSAETKVEGLERRAAKIKPTISIIGAGRMGTALALAFHSHGYQIDAVVARHKAQARRAAKLFSPHTLALTNTQLDQLPASDFLLITTPDDVIESVAEQLAATLVSWKMKGADQSKRQRVVLHASGALSSDALRSLKRAGCAVGSLHPLVSVSDPAHGARSLSSAFFCIEGDARAQRAARALVRALRARSFTVSTKDKALYHAAAVMTSGHVTALFDVATEMLARCGLTAARAREVFLPLLQSTLENLYLSDPARALTGTFARADVATVHRHITALRGKGMRDALAVYRLLGLRSLKLAKTAGANSTALKEIEKLLESWETRA